MKEIVFNTLHLSNFKGIEQFDLQFSNKTALRGANGTGKTTIADALWWVLFNKDSGGSSDFPVKRKDSQGNDIHNIIVEVSLNLSVNGTHHLFRRVQEENWVTKRGSTEPVMEGNVQTLYYNESKMKSKEYADAVGAIVDEESFKLLTNPMYFMTQIDHKKRREILLKLVGNEKDIESSIRSKAEFHLLNTEWNQDLNQNKSFAQLFETMKQKAKQNQEELDRLPYQIDELKRTITITQDETSLKTLISAYTKELEQLSQSTKPVFNEQVMELERKLSEAQTKHYRIMESATQEFRNKQNRILMDRQDITFKETSLKSKITLLNNQIESNKQLLDRKQSQRQELLTEFKRIEASTWDKPHVDDHCPTCGQALPGTNIDKVLADHKLHFEQDKQKKLGLIIEQGKEIAAQIQGIQKEIDKDTSTVIETVKAIEIESMKLSSLADPNLITVDEFIDKTQLELVKNEIHETQSQLNIQYELTKNESAVTAQTTERTKELQALINDTNQRLGALNAQKETQKRIVELQGRESSLISDKNRYKTLVFQCEQFERLKNEEIEYQLSTHFGRVKWRLFKPQLNGGYQQVCDALLDGKPFDAQSTGERIFTGCDIIKTFQGIYAIECPVIIDNRESLTLALPSLTQTLSLYADERYPDLLQV